MSRYIDAELLKQILKPREWGTPDERWIPEHEIGAMLDYFPAADVAEVKHGKWVFKFYCGNMSGYDYGMTCSVCGKPTHRQFAEKMPPFCPNCGTRMDLDGDTE